jgi:hypothetical protein
MTASARTSGATSTRAMWTRAAVSETRKLLGLRSTWIVLSLSCAFSMLVGYMTLPALGSLADPESGGSSIRSHVGIEPSSE